MVNRIDSVTIQDRRIDPAVAELQVWVHPHKGNSSMEVRGRFTGPHCRYSSTVEVAYPCCEELREWQKGPSLISLRIVIPEPSLWDPETPFLYRGHVELWDQGQLCDQAEISHGLRIPAEVGSHGLRWNGRLLSLRGVRRSQCSEDEALQLRLTGCNLILAPVTPQTRQLWQMADQWGFLMLGFIEDKKGYEQIAEIDQHLQDRIRHQHASCLGWVLPEHILQDPEIIAMHDHPVHGLVNRLFGVELKEQPSRRLPRELRFVVCEESLLPDLSDIRLPKLVTTQHAYRADEEPAKTSQLAGILGRVYR